MQCDNINVTMSYKHWLVVGHIVVVVSCIILIEYIKRDKYNFKDGPMFAIVLHTLLYTHYVSLFIMLFHGSTAPVGKGLLIGEVSRSLSDTSHSVWLLWPSDRSVAENSTWQQTTLSWDRYPCPPPRGIRTRNPSKRAAAEPRLKPRGHWDRLFVTYLLQNITCLSATIR